MVVATCLCNSFLELRLRILDDGRGVVICVDGHSEIIRLRIYDQPVAAPIRKNLNFDRKNIRDFLSFCSEKLRDFLSSTGLYRESPRYEREMDRKRAAFSRSGLQEVIDFLTCGQCRNRTRLLSGKSATAIGKTNNGAQHWFTEYFIQGLIF